MYTSAVMSFSVKIAFVYLMCQLIVGVWVCTAWCAPAVSHVWNLERNIFCAWFSPCLFCTDWQACSASVLTHWSTSSVPFWWIKHKQHIDCCARIWTFFFCLKKIVILFIDTVVYQIEISEPGMGYFFSSCWSVGSPNIAVTVIALILAYSPELDNSEVL